jgi:hypothetical protein
VIVFPSEARYVGEHGTTWIADQVFVDRPGEWIADRVRGQRVGVYGLDYVMTVHDHTALTGACELVGWDIPFDTARAVKSELELESVRESVRINTEGWVFLEAFVPGRTEREMLIPCEGEPSRRVAGAGRWTWSSTPGGAAAGVPGSAQRATRRGGRRLSRRSDRRAGRPLGRGLARDLRHGPSDDTADARGVRQYHALPRRL